MTGTARLDERVEQRHLPAEQLERCRGAALAHELDAVAQHGHDGVGPARGLDRLGDHARGPAATGIAMSGRGWPSGKKSPDRVPARGDDLGALRVRDLASFGRERA